MVSAKEAVNFFGVIQFSLVNYTGTVIPIIFVVFVQAWVEKKLNKYIPKSVNLVFVPMLTFLIMGTLALSILARSATSSAAISQCSSPSSAKMLRGLLRS